MEPTLALNLLYSPGLSQYNTGPSALTPCVLWSFLLGDNILDVDTNENARNQEGQTP